MYSTIMNHDNPDHYNNGNSLVEMMKICSPLISVKLIPSSREVALSYLIMVVNLMILMKMKMMMTSEKASDDDQGDEIDEDLNLLPLHDVPRSDQNKSRTGKAFCHVGLTAKNDNHDFDDDHDFDHDHDIRW